MIKNKFRVFVLFAFLLIPLSSFAVSITPTDFPYTVFPNNLPIVTCSDINNSYFEFRSTENGGYGISDFQTCVFPFSANLDNQDEVGEYHLIEINTDQQTFCASFDCNAGSEAVYQGFKNSEYFVGETNFSVIPDSTKAITAFSFPEGTGVINGMNIAVNVPFNTNITSLIATFTNTGESVKIGDIFQISGTTANDFTSPLIYTVTSQDATTQDYIVSVNVLSENQIPAAPEVLVNETQNEVVVESSAPTTITVPLEVIDATINVSSLTLDNGTTVIAELPAITLNVTTSLSTNAVVVAIPENTVISAPTGWTGVINVPQTELNSSVVVLPDSGYTAEVSSVVEIGYGDVKLTFDNAVRILLPEQAGKYAGYFRDGVFYEISDTCSADSQIAGNALAPEEDCKIDVGSDMVIWTKHFTKFVTFTQTLIPGGEDKPRLCWNGKKFKKCHEVKI